jgi:hypothetical protein
MAIAVSTALLGWTLAIAVSFSIFVDIPVSILSHKNALSRVTIKQAIATCLGVFYDRDYIRRADQGDRVAGR